LNYFPANQSALQILRKFLEEFDSRVHGCPALPLPTPNTLQLQTEEWVSG
jgi:hypothetical protein